MKIRSIIAPTTLNGVHINITVITAHAPSAYPKKRLKNLFYKYLTMERFYHITRQLVPQQRRLVLLRGQYGVVVMEFLRNL